MSRSENQQALTADLARIASFLQRHAAARDAGDVGGGTAPAAERADDADGSPVGALCRIFGLTPFERDVLLLCAAVELDAPCAADVARLQDGAPPTFALALALLPEARCQSHAQSADTARNYSLLSGKSQRIGCVHPPLQTLYLHEGNLQR